MLRVRVTYLLQAEATTEVDVPDAGYSEADLLEAIEASGTLPLDADAVAVLTHEEL